MKTLQEVYTTVRRHLLTQGVQAWNCDNGCCYRDDEGRKCAVGCLIQDACYDPKIESKLSDHPDVIAALQCSGIVVDQQMRDLLGVLQGMHDDHNPFVWCHELNQIARNFDLIIEPDVLSA